MLRAWKPLARRAVANIFHHAEFPWWIAGGYAIDAFVGRTTRPHSDIDVLVLHRDHVAARQLLAAWYCCAADPPGTLVPWSVGRGLEPDVHDVWCAESAGEPWRFQLMLDGDDGEGWHSRRCKNVSKRVDELGFNADGIPHLVPEVQLFYKARNPRPQDDADFGVAFPLLDDTQKRWLSDAIMTA